MADTGQEGPIIPPWDDWDPEIWTALRAHGQPLVLHRRAKLRAQVHRRLDLAMLERVLVALHLSVLYRVTPDLPSAARAHCSDGLRWDR